jgi:hypothetical protein
MIKVSEAVDHNRSRVRMPSSLISTVTRHHDRLPDTSDQDADHLAALASGSRKSRSPTSTAWLR